MRMKRLTVLFAILLLLTAVLTSCQQKEEEPTAESIYQGAIAQLQEGKYAEAGEAFAGLGHYYDATRYAMYCSALNSAESGSYELAASSMQALAGFMDSNIQAVYWTGRAYEETERYEAAQGQYSQILQYGDAGTRAAALPGKILERDYKAACSMEENKSYRAAISAFEALNGYQDSEEHIASIRIAMEKEANEKAYAEAEQLEKADRLEEAAEAFRALDEYSDSVTRASAIDEKIREREYQKAVKLEEADDLVSAYKIYQKLGDYQDVAARAEAIRKEAGYRSAFDSVNSGELTTARTAYLGLGEYKDSVEKARLLGVCELAEETKLLNSGIVSFKLQDLWGYIDLNNNYDVAPAYNSIGLFSETTDLAIISYTRNDSTYYGLVNRKGRQVAGSNYLEIREGQKGFYTAVTKEKSFYNFALLSPAGQELSRWRTLGNSSTGSRYSAYYLYGPSFINGVILAVDADGMCAMINDRGETVLQGARDITLMSRQGYCDTACVRWRNGWQLTALDGTPLSDQVWAEVQDFQDGYAAVCTNDGLWGYVSAEDCQVAIEPQYQGANAFSESLAGVKKGDEWGFIDEQNNMVIEPEYMTVTAFSQNCAAVQKYIVGWQVIDKTGRLLYFKQNAYLAADELDQYGLYEQAIAGFESLEGYADSTERALQSREKINATVYAQAELLEDEGRYIEAAETFEWLGEYSDAPQRAAAARENQNATTYASAAALEEQGDLESAIAIYLTLGEYQGSAQHAADLREGINQGICAEADELETAEKYEAAIRTLNQIPDYTGVAEHIAALEEKIRVRDYNAAAALEDEGKFEDAIIAFTAMGDYSDSKERIPVIEEKIRQRNYNAAAALEEEGRFEEAIEAFTVMGDYSDSKERIGTIRDKIKQRAYEAAAELEEEGKFEAAINAFAVIRDYSDSADRIRTIYGKIQERDYNAAAALEEAGNFADAYTAFIALGEYSDSAARAVAVTEKAEEQKRQIAYAVAAEAEEKGELEDAAARFEALEEYSDAADRLAAVQEKIRARDYEAAVKALNEEDYLNAYNIFLKLGEYKDSVTLFDQASNGVNYQKALADALAGKITEAYQQFSALGDYKDSEKKKEICGNLSRASKTREITTGVLIYDFHDLWGIANLNSNIITAAKYNSIEYNKGAEYSKYNLLKVFISGGEANRTGWYHYVHADDKYGYINLNGEEVIECKYFAISDFNPNGLCTITKRDTSKDDNWNGYHKYLFGIADRNGRIISSPSWKTMGDSNNTKWGKSSRKTEFISDYCETEIPVFFSGRMKVQNRNNLWGFINEKGQILGEVKWYSIGNFSDGMAMVCEEISTGRYSHEYKYGFINEQGQQVGEVRWDEVNAFSNGLAAVQENGYWGFINKNNELVIPCQYTEVSSFKEDGTCDVKTKDGTWQVINTVGEVSFF